MKNDPRLIHRLVVGSQSKPWPPRSDASRDAAMEMLPLWPSSGCPLPPQEEHEPQSLGQKPHKLLSV